MSSLISIFFRLLMNHKLAFLSLFLVATIIPVIFAMIISPLIGSIYAINPSINQAEFVFKTVCYVAGVFFIAQLSHHIKGLFLSRIVSGINFDSQKFFLSKLIKKDLTFFYPQNEGLLSERVSALGEYSTEGMNNIFFQFYSHAVEIISAVINSLLISKYIGGLLFIWPIVFLTLGYLFNVPLVRLSKKLANIRSGRKGTAIEIIKNIVINKTLQLQNVDTEEYLKVLKEEKQTYSKLMLLQWIQNAFLSMVNACFFCFGIYLAFKVSILDLKNPAMYPRFLFFITWHSNFVILILRSIIPIIQKFGLCSISKDILSTETEKIKRGEENVPNNPTIVFENVEKTIANDTFLKRVDCKIKLSDNVLLEGKSGSGKTTLFLLLLGILNHTKGNITVNNKNLLDIDNKKWLDQFAYVPQNALLYNDTIRNNIIKGLDYYSESDFIKVCEICLVDDFVKDLKDGYDYRVGVGGNSLSGGQKQRVVLARALMRDYNIVNGCYKTNKRTLCLDEAWSSLSREEALIMAKNLSKEIGHRGFIVIDHTGIWKDICGKKIDSIYTIENGIVSK